MQCVEIEAPLAPTLLMGQKTMVGVRPGTRERAFAKRLNQALDMHPRSPAGYGRNSWLMRELTHANVEVSLETIRKWLAGETGEDSD